jgi:hypothetical protein
MSRAKFTQAFANRLARAAAQNGVTMRAEFSDKDGNKIIISARPQDDAEPELIVTPDDALERWRKQKSHARQP